MKYKKPNKAELSESIIIAIIGAIATILSASFGAIGVYLSKKSTSTNSSVLKNILNKISETKKIQEDIEDRLDNKNDETPIRKSFYTTLKKYSKSMFNNSILNNENKFQK